MAITTKAGLQAAMKGGQFVTWPKNTSSQAGGQGKWACFFDLVPNAGTLAGANTANGVVPDDTVAGFPPINSFGGGNTGYIGSIQLCQSSTSANAGSRYLVADCLFKAGAYSFNANTTLTAQPSYSARVPGADYKGLGIWLEFVTSFTGIPSVAITYTNQDGTAGRTTGTIALPAAPIAHQIFWMPLQSGDTGVQKIESVVATVATVGTFNVLVLRPLWMGRIPNNNMDRIYGPDEMDLPIIFDNSALYVAAMTEFSTNVNPNFELGMTIIQG